MESHPCLLIRGKKCKETLKGRFLKLYLLKLKLGMA